MTVSQLISKLAEFPDTTPVMIDGYEEGVEDVENSRISIVHVALDYEDAPQFVGPHRLLTNVNNAPAGYKIKVAVLIARKS